MANLIDPRTLKGFRDYPPALMIPRERVLETARRVYRSYGFAPIDTPALEYAEVLLGKGGGENDKIVYRFKDHGDRDVALRFDLTVPFARFAAAEVPKLGVPFKRYAMGPVWRGENTGHGRYREFWQCDFDTIGTTSNAADIETVLVINDLFTALGFEDFTIRVNNRLVLNGILEALGVSDRATPILRAIDKFDKVGEEVVRRELMDDSAGRAGLQKERIDIILQFTVKSVGKSLREQLYYLRDNFPGVALVEKGQNQLAELFDVFERAVQPCEGRLVYDPSIARGLDYYTGIICETFLPGELAGFGSVCSGGRYDNLASLYTKQVLPGVGASLGVDRLLAAMEAMKHPWLGGRSTPADVLVVQFDPARLGDYQRIARELRAAGIATEVYPEAKKLKAQFEYADRRGFRLVLIAGPEEFDKGVVKVKDLAKREEITVWTGDLVEHTKAALR